MVKTILFLIILFTLLGLVAVLHLPSGFSVGALCAAIFLVRKL
jgi:hypothetical protein